MDYETSTESSLLNPNTCFLIGSPSPSFPDQISTRLILEGGGHCSLPETSDFSFLNFLEAVMGSLRFEPRHLIYPHRRNPVPLTTSSSPVFTVTGSKSSIVVGRKEPTNNESSDSGCSGLDNRSTTSNKGLSTLIQPADDNLHQYIIDHSKNTSYLKGKFLGKGGSARVHELTDLTTGNVYAGKIIPKSRITEPRHKEKITREIELQRNLVHLNVVRYHHSFEDIDNFYIIVENCSKKVCLLVLMNVEVCYFHVLFHDRVWCM